MAAMPDRPEIPLEPDPRVRRALRAAQEALSHQNWDGAVLASGTVVREVARSHLVYNDQQGTLPQLIERLVKQQAAEPALVELAAALKPTGPLSGFFDLEADIDGPLAEATLALVADLITHVYGFRAKVRRLTELVEAARDAEAGTAAAASGREEPVAAAGTPSVRGTAAGAGPTPEERSPSDGANPDAADDDAFDGFETDPLRERWRER